MCICICLWVYACVSKCLQRPERLTDPLELELQAGMTCPMWVLGNKLDPLQEHHAPLTTDIFFQPQLDNLNKIKSRVSLNK